MRVGKTATTIRVCEVSKAQRILVLTKKAAIDGWHSELARTEATKDYTVTNYEQAAKLPADFDLAILDESHCLAALPKPSKRWKAVRELVYGKPIILSTGTPSSEVALQLYPQFAMSPYSPFKEYKNFYDFHSAWGEPAPIRINGRMQETYKKAKDGLTDFVKPWTVTLTQDDAGIVHQAQDKLHTVPLSASTKELIRTLQEDKVVEIAGKLRAFESDMAERQAVMQIEYGAMYLDDEFIDLGNTEVMDYLEATFGDSPDNAYMAHYRATRVLLARRFPQSKVFSSNRHAEGVSLAHFKNFIIVNQDFSGARYLQRRERSTNLMRTEPVIVHQIVCEGMLSERVYKVLSDKKSFTLDMYRRLRNG